MDYYGVFILLWDLVMFCLASIGSRCIDAVKSEGISGVRNETVPAYCFTNFGKLLVPVGIQLQIWSLASRTEEPQTHAVTSMSNDNSQDFLPGARTYCLEGSSWINCKTKTWAPWRRRIPTILHACQQSRAVVLKIYTCLAARYHAGSWEEREMYFNTLYNSFYMGYKK